VCEPEVSVVQSAVLKLRNVEPNARGRGRWSASHLFPLSRGRPVYTTSVRPLLSTLLLQLLVLYALTLLLPFTHRWPHSGAHVAGLSCYSLPG
jgi:hypothetical protein